MNSENLGYCFHTELSVLLFLLIFMFFSLFKTKIKCVYNYKVLSDSLVITI